MELELTGRVLGGRFEMLSPLGEGGYGAVYLAEQVTMGRKVAVKVIHPRVADTEDFVERFEREARVASRLQHPNTVVYFDFGRDDDIHFLAMEFVEGRTLSKDIAESGPMSLARAAHLAIQICGALAEAHALGMVHRDLKPANILLTERGGDSDFVKVIDFGLAKIVQGDREVSRQDLTAEGVLLGTPAYMAPEQIRGKHVDNRCDVYALGVILFVMLTGQKPYEGDTPLGTAVMHLTEEIPHVRSLNPGVPEEMEQLITQCLAKSPADRLSTVDELAERLHDIVERYGLEETGRRRRTGAGTGLSSSSTSVNTTTLDPTPSTQSGKRLAHGVAVLAGNHSSDTVHSGQLTPKGSGSVSRGLILGLAASLVLAAGVTLAVIGEGNGGDDAAAAASGSGLEMAGAEVAGATSDEEAGESVVVEGIDQESAAQLARLPWSQNIAQARVEVRLALAEATLGSTVAANQLLAQRNADDDHDDVERDDEDSRRTSRRTRADRDQDEDDSDSSRSDRGTEGDDRPREGRLRITAIPYGIVTCDGRRYGRTPVDEVVPVGYYDCEIESPTGDIAERRIAIDGDNDRLETVRFGR